MITRALRSGELAEAAGVNVQTLRYYERRGLLAKPARSPGGHRKYSDEDLTILRAIKTAQRLGFSLSEVTTLVDLGRHRHSRTDRGLQARAAAKLAEVEAKLAEVEAKISDLEVIASTLRTALAAGCDDLARCASTDGCPLPFTVRPGADSP
jgi:MerR family mercuric resistance operon transcriptional regulator